MSGVHDSNREGGQLFSIIIGVAFVFILFYFGQEFIKVLYVKLLYHLDTFMYELTENVEFFRHAAKWQLAKEYQDVMNDISFSEVSWRMAFYMSPLIAFAFIMIIYKSLFLFIGKKVDSYISIPGKNLKHYSVANIDNIIRENAKIFPEMRPVVGMQKYLIQPKNMYSGPWRVQDDYLTLALTNAVIYDECAEKNNGKRIYWDMKKAAPVIQKIKGIKEIGPIEEKGGDDDKKMENLSESGVRFKKLDRERMKKCFKLDREKIKKVFEKQLGYKYGKRSGTKKGESEQLENLLKNMPDQHKALLAVFLLFWRSGGEDGEGLLDQFNNSYAYSGDRKKYHFDIKDLNMTNVNEILRNYLLGESVPEDFPYKKATAEDVEECRDMVFGHAFLNPMMVAAFVRARKAAILISSSFIWLRPIDRTLWATLNNTGKENDKNVTAFPECAGVFAHYMIEKVAGFGIDEPVVDEAVIAIEYGLWQEGWISWSERGESLEKMNKIDAVVKAASEKGNEGNKRRKWR